MRSERVRFGVHRPAITVPDLLSIQLHSFRAFMDLSTPPEKQEKEWLYRVFKENFPVRDSKEEYEMDFRGYLLDPPRYTPEECKERGLTYGVQLKARFALYPLEANNEVFKPKEEWVYLGTVPYMTPQGTFIVSGVERVVINQLHRSPGILFSAAQRAGTSEKTYGAKIIPTRGTWIELATDATGYTRVYLDRKKALPVTLLLRAMGHGSDAELVQLFGIAEEVPLKLGSIKSFLPYVGRRLATRIVAAHQEELVDPETGEMTAVQRFQQFFDVGHVLSEEDWNTLSELRIDRLYLIKPEYEDERHIILATLRKDPSYSVTTACQEIYKLLRGTEGQTDPETARQYVEKQILSDKRYDLGEVGRYQLNRKLYGEQRFTDRLLRVEDLVAIIARLHLLMQGKVEPDEEDHLSHRRIRTVGEHMYQQFSVGLSRLAKGVREKMSTMESEDFKPSDVINHKAFLSAINQFFARGQLSQLVDQTNPLSELAHKRRISAIGPGGLSRERAGFEARDVHFSHYGRICPIETPEGANIGLINSLAIYARINELGFLETPYHPVTGWQAKL
jgi:DNA-directed RNA polymerase subunit beta